MDALGAGFNIVTGTSTGMQQVIAFTYDTQSIYTNVCQDLRRIHCLGHLTLPPHHSRTVVGVHYHSRT